MSCNYADGLSPYENKGVLGVPEKFDSIDKFNKKCELLAQFITQAKHVVVHTGAGISTSAGIPDFRGPNGVWTLEREGKRPTTNISFTAALPTKTHMILKKLVECNKVHYIVSQNIDGLHLKSGLPRKYLAELHGNMFVDECNLCKRQFVRSCPVETVGKKCSGIPCAAEHVTGRPCRGRLYDGVLDWEHSLPENDLLMAEWHSSIADLSICLGTTLQIVPSGNLPLETLKYGGQLVICNLQPTKHDNKADLIINYYVDDILEKVMGILGIDIPTYCDDDNPTKRADSAIIDWTINRHDVMKLEKIFKSKCKGVKKIRNLVKSKRKSTDENSMNGNSKSKLIKFNGHIEEVNVENNSVEVKIEKNVLVKEEDRVVDENREDNSVVDKDKEMNNVSDDRVENSVVDEDKEGNIVKEKDKDYISVEEAVADVNSVSGESKNKNSVFEEENDKNSVFEEGKDKNSVFEEDKDKTQVMEEDTDNISVDEAVADVNSVVEEVNDKNSVIEEG